MNKTKTYIKSIFPHLVFWMIYIVIWSVRELVYYNNLTQLISVNFIFCLFYAPFIYFHLYYIVPKLLMKRKIIPYGLMTIAGIMAFCFITTKGTALVLSIFHKMPPESYWFNNTSGRLISASEIVILLGISTSLYLFNEWYRKDRYAKELEKRNLETELQFLKNQINPHFVFNSLNTIYHLIPKEAYDAKDVLMQFSDSLSHQLYDAQKKLIPLEKELVYLKNFIAIEKVRSGDNLDLKTNWPISLNGEQIPPMLLIPILENAFKHSKSNQKYFVDIQANIKNKILKFQVQNSIGDEIKNEENSGIGLKNLKRRLELLYPEKHKIGITQNDKTYSVTLELKLNEVKLSDH